MKASKYKNRPRNCPSCGAPVSTEYCPYCGVATGLDSSMANMEYPVIDCKEVLAISYDIRFMLMMGIPFTFIGAAMVFLDLMYWKTMLTAIIGVPFMLFGVGLWISPLFVLSRVIFMKIFGRKIQAKVYGYLEDDMTINNRPAQIVKLLVQTKDGPKFLLYQLSLTSKPYGKGSTVNLKVIGNRYMLCDTPGIEFL